jgi:hypothetical protein
VRADGLTECDGACVDLARDAQHCGGCALSCAPSVACEAGACASCAPVALASTVPQTETEPIAGHVDALETSCTSDHGPDATFTFTAPADGRYIFDASCSSLTGATLEVLDGGTCTAPADATYHVDTSSSLMSAMLHAHDGSCAGPELACDRRFVSEVSLPLTAGQAVILVVDGNAGEYGPFQLNIYGELRDTAGARPSSSRCSEAPHPPAAAPEPPGRVRRPARRLRGQDRSLNLQRVFAL